MQFIEHHLYHIYNQGNNQQNIFSSPEDYIIFLKQARSHILTHTDIVAYCLMPNHFHFLIYTNERVNDLIQQGGILIDPVTNAIRKLLSGYARIYNKRYNKSGSLFRQKTKSKCLTEIKVCENKPITLADYCFNCFNYIHQNPLKAKLVRRMENWEYSSFKDYAGLRNGTLCNKAIAEKYCSFDANNFIKDAYCSIDEESFGNFL